MKFEPMNAQKARENSADSGLSYEDREILQGILDQIEHDSEIGCVYSNFTQRYETRSEFCQDNIKRSLRVRGFHFAGNQIYWD